MGQDEILVAAAIFRAHAHVEVMGSAGLVWSAKRLTL
ncbi:hypothetical protein Rrhod_4123 [Rhodococcus rhodnii LMG 5362]|uniref:Uncharacterized protein n=1 Tax=Rhodococcus rhodnii LMG 5362 TaxID=1273125 RepID=R7WKH5_9NOCA|nr:hypothetical protein Rrhod_4123 [Rhodococcus rhodnii LMG 5362]